MSSGVSKTHLVVFDVFAHVTIGYYWAMWLTTINHVNTFLCTFSSLHFSQKHYDKINCLYAHFLYYRTVLFILNGRGNAMTIWKRKIKLTLPDHVYHMICNVFCLVQFNKTKYRIQIYSLYCAILISWPFMALWANKMIEWSYFCSTWVCGI